MRPRKRWLEMGAVIALAGGIVATAATLRHLRELEQQRARAMHDALEDHRTSRGVLKLLRDGVSANSRTPFGRTPLMKAISYTGFKLAPAPVTAARVQTSMEAGCPPRSSSSRWPRAGDGKRRCCSPWRPRWSS